MISGNLSVHKGKEVREWAARRRRLTILHTPTYASWLNQVEIFFNIFTREVMRGGVWSSKKELIERTMYYIKRYNETATPFAWNYTGKPLTV